MPAGAVTESRVFRTAYTAARDRHGRKRATRAGSVRARVSHERKPSFVVRERRGLIRRTERAVSAAPDEELGRDKTVNDRNPRWLSVKRFQTQLDAGVRSRWGATEGAVPSP